MKPPPLTDQQLDDFFTHLRAPAGADLEADLGAAERFLSRQAAQTSWAPRVLEPTALQPTASQTRPASVGINPTQPNNTQPNLNRPNPSRAYPHRRPQWPTWLAAAALLGGFAVLRLPAGADPLPSSAAYEVYSSALGSEW